ncbi:cupin [Vineibacter terrae]|uniref:Cupin n=1 Tax=Vineibacter terrae TaxID=2586908 RepID=A0A5C8PVL1_9HYPH|nr:cupin domain-containing protein [Vineibacter terrae]TXL82358.1 cupin [Vineibacter terrae]
MRINDDLTQPAIVHAAKLDWIASPAAGVDRRMLFRIGSEVARATSIVRYAPGSAFPRHTHGGGEEIVVLDGVFEDEHGAYPAGSYFRNPPGTSHIPASKDGCTIFVRLWQFRAGDQAQIVRQPGEGEKAGPRPGAASATVLFDDGDETVRLEDWGAGATVTVDNPRGLEFLVLFGGITIGHETLEPQSWGRLPANTPLTANIGSQGARIWIKDAPLLHADVCQLPG